MSTPRPRISRKFSFDYDPDQSRQSRAPVDEILDSMNRTSQAGEILDYDPELESYLEDHYSRHSGGRRAGIALFGLMLVSGVGLIWFYGGLAKVFDATWLRTRYVVLGQSVPLWMGLGAMMLFLLALAVARRRNSGQLVSTE